MSINEHCPDLAKTLYLSGLHDGKNIVDADPASGMTFGQVGLLYEQQCSEPDFDLGAFVVQNLAIRGQCIGAGFISERERLLSHANQLIVGNKFYQPLSRGTRIGLPGVSLQPCPGRFAGEQYAHDTGKIVQGLAADTTPFEIAGDVSLDEDDRWGLIQSMVDNQVHMQNSNGAYNHRIPTANCEYYLSRYQISYLASNVMVLADRYEALHEGAIGADHPLIKYQNALITDWHVWNGGRRNFSRSNNIGEARDGVVLLDKEGTFGSYYLDLEGGPRLEMWAEDMRALQAAQKKNPSIDPDEFFAHWRAGAASGWDYSSERHFAIPDDPTTIQSSHILHVDHTSKQFELEEAIAKSYELSAFYFGQQGNAEQELRARELLLRWQARARRTSEMIRNYHRDPDTGYYYDYNYRTGQRTRAISTAGMYPLLVGAVNKDEATEAAAFFEQELVREGGVRVTNTRSKQQWDGLSWPGEEDAVAMALHRYGFARLGFLVTSNAIDSNQAILQQHGSLPENYDPDSPLGTGSSADGSEGEYERQQNFTWAATSMRLAHVLRAKFADMLEELPPQATRETAALWQQV